MTSHQRRIDARPCATNQRMTPRARMRLRIAVAVVVAIVPGNALPFGHDMPALALRISRAGSVTHASCTLIARQAAGENVVLYFVTAARLFATGSGGGAPIASVVIDPGGRRLLVRPDDVILPTGMPIDVALLRVTVEQSDLEPAALAFDPPPVAAPFTIHVVAGDGGSLAVPQRVRMVSPGTIGGDVTIPWSACLGAPAGTDGRTFGVVTDCDGADRPTISLVGTAREFLGRHIRDLRASTVAPARHR
jgi:hypothetical protein